MLMTALLLVAMFSLSVLVITELNGTALVVMIATYLWYDYVMKSTITELVYRGCKRIWMMLRWVQFLWRHDDSDYSYAIEAFSIQLKHISKFLDSDRAYAMDAKFNAARIRTVLKLLKKVNDEDYAMEYMTEIAALYGKRSFQVDDTNRLKYKFDTSYTEDELTEINRHEKALYQKSKLKQEKARRILIRLIDENIEKWWD